jgi:hypothetical protein
MRRTEKYAAVTRDEGDAADGRFPTASLEVLHAGLLKLLLTEEQNIIFNSRLI